MEPQPFAQWIRTSELYPESGRLVEWLDSAGNIIEGKMVGRLWFFRDCSMYIYYVPEFWRYDDGN